jgi:pimeloyl-ACP methyl ester carboxylesterase
MKTICSIAIYSIIGLILLPGCSDQMQMQTQTVQPDLPGHHGIVYYLDGAGGGAIVTDWGRGVRKGLKMGGFKGEFVEYKWQTHLGVLADQDSSVEYKRDKAVKLATMIAEYAQTHPGEPINIIGLSAGTAVAVYTLEALPKWCTVDVVILLGSSLDAQYNMTKALERVEDDLYVFTSSKDGVLGMLVPMTGTADREYAGRGVAGIKGFIMPRNLDVQARASYSKIVNVRWQQGFAKTGNFGGHTGGTHPRFVAEYLTPLLIPEGPRTMYAKHSELVSATK